jgi:hypothetical protein
LRDNEDKRATDGEGYITVKAIHVWGPFIFQLVVLLGGYFAGQQKLTDMQTQLDRLQAEIVELRAHAWK